MNQPQPNQQQPDEHKTSNNLESQLAVLRASIQITRKATGKVETYEIVGTAVPQQEQPQ